MYLHAAEDDQAQPQDRGVNYAAKTLRYETIQEGVKELVQEILDTGADDLARAGALTLMACSAAAELDDYVTCTQVLDFLIELTSSCQKDASALLVRAAVLQQKSLRLWDSGLDPQPTSAEALRTLDNIDMSSFPHFSTGPYTTSRRTLEHVISALRHAIWSLAPFYPTAVGASHEWPDFPSRDEMLESPKSEELIRIRADRVESYSKFVSQTFKNQYRSRTRYLLGGPAVPDIFPQALALELIGHAGVREARKELALLRLVQIDTSGDASQVRDALRLLRHAGAETELSLAVERMRSGGPLWALSEDARQILRERGTAHLLRSPELRVLRGAAELMTPIEAKRALGVVRSILEEGGPANIPGRWQRDSERVGDAWLTAARLANSASLADEMARYFLEIAKSSARPDELIDRALAKATNVLDWEAVSVSAVNYWSTWVQGTGEGWPATSEVVGQLCGLRSGESTIPEDLEAVALQVNQAIRGTELSQSMVTASSPLVAGALRKLTDDARKGLHSFGSLDPADIGAALISYGNADLWEELGACLVSPATTREETNYAFERLAHERPSMPIHWKDIFSKNHEQILSKENDTFREQKSISPYPPALRFLAAYNLIDDATLFTSIAKLAGEINVRAREEAARTVALLATLRSDTWLLAIGTQLSHDHDVSTRSHAGRSLALFSTRDQEASSMLSSRIVQLLREDGVEVPIRLLGALKGKQPRQAAVRKAIEQVASDHPSRLVRSAALAVVR
ncbi:hypothetical protein ACIBW9_19340 [Streptomyces sp. NPDC049541]|uniref:hypothetical protein n=1 Tax=Streptomyces sp. NPDC049541 TaxID=3365594 RepID=UPI00378B877B